MQRNIFLDEVEGNFTMSCSMGMLGCIAGHQNLAGIPTSTSLDIQIQTLLLQVRPLHLLIVLVVLLGGVCFHILRVRGLKKRVQKLSRIVEERGRVISGSGRCLDEAEQALLTKGVQLQEKTLELEQANRLLDRMSNQDSLTGVANRQYMDQFLNLEWRRALREEQPLSLLMVDIDFFKLYNDCYGRQAGDECLKKIAQTLSMIHRAGDLVARIGGEEFLVVLANTDQEGAYNLAERMRLNVAALRIPHTCSIVDVYLTISLGGVTMIPERDSFFSQGILRADQALGLAKQQGRNRVYLFNSPQG